MVVFMVFSWALIGAVLLVQGLWFLLDSYVTHSSLAAYLWVVITSTIAAFNISNSYRHHLLRNRDIRFKYTLEERRMIIMSLRCSAWGILFFLFIIYYLIYLLLTIYLIHIIDIPLKIKPALYWLCITLIGGRFFHLINDFYEEVGRFMRDLHGAGRIKCHNALCRFFLPPDAGVQSGDGRQ